MICYFSYCKISKKTSIVWQYVSNEKCQVKDKTIGNICDKQVSNNQLGHVWRHFKCFHTKFHDELKKKETPESSDQPKIDLFIIQKSGPLKDLAFFIATSTASLSILENERFKVNLNFY